MALAFSDTFALLRFDTFPFVDSSSAPTFVVNSAGVTHETALSRFGGGSARFNGVSSTLQLIDRQQPLQLLDKDFTIECWFTYESTGGNAAQLFNVTGNSQLVGVRLEGSSGSTINLYVFDAVRISVSGRTWAANTFYHLAVVRTGATLTMYLDGTALGSYNIGTTSLSVSTLQLYIGTYSGSSVTWKGCIDEFRIVTNNAVYTAPFTPPTAPLGEVGASGVYPQVFMPGLDGTEFRETALPVIPPPVFHQLDVSPQFSEPVPDPGTSFIDPAPSDGLPYGLYKSTDKVDGIVTTGWSWDLRGPGRVFGTLKVAGPPNVPISRRLRLVREADGAFVADTTSDAATGAYEFLGVPVDGSTFTVLAYDYERQYRAVVADGVRPQLLGFAASIPFYLNLISGLPGGAAEYLPDPSLVPALDDLARVTADGAARVLTSGLQRFIVAPSALGSSDPYFNSVALLLPFDSDFSTAGASSKTISSTGVTITAALKKFGVGSAYFSGGTTNFVRVTVDNTLQFDSNPFTIECWVYQTDQSGNRAIFDFAEANPFRLIWESGTLKLQHTSSGTTVITSNQPFSINTWHHVAVVRSSSDVTLYVNGLSAGVWSNAPSLSAASDAPLWIGCNRGDTWFWSGYIDDFRITKGVDRYTGAFTPPIEAFPTSGSPATDPSFGSVSVLLDFNSVIEDESSNAFAITTSGTIAISIDQKKFGTHSLNCGGGYLALPTDAKFELRASQTWTIEFWVFISSSYAPVIWSGGSANEIILTGPGRNNVMYAPSHWNAGGDAAVMGSSVAIPANTWTHIALVAESASVGKLYVGGQLGATVGAINVDLKYIGGNGGVVGSSAFSGYLDDVRVTKGVARYTADFTPPIQAFPTA